MKEVQFMEEERELLKDVSRTPKDKVVNDLISYELDEQSLDHYFLVSSNLKEREKIELIEFLKVNIEVFVWTQYKMSGIDPNFISHELNVMPEARSLKHWVRRYATNTCGCGDIRGQESKRGKCNN